MKEHIRKKVIFFGICLLIALIIAIMLVCKSCTDSTDTTYPTIDNAATVYENAAGIVNDKQNISLYITYKKEVLVDNEFLTEQSKQHITYEALGTEQMRGYVDETLIVGNHTIEITEIYADNKMYFTVEGSHFSGDIDSAAYLSRYTPALPLSADLYNTVTGVDTGDGFIVSFSDPADIEPWVNAAGGQFGAASGSAYIDSEGQLTKSIYTTSYSVDDVYIRLSATVEISYEAVSPIQLPETPESYIQLAYPDAPRMLEKACGYLLDAASVRANYADIISCEAFGDKREQNISLRTAQDTAWSAQIDTIVEIVNSSKAGVVTTYTQTERFSDNVYTIAVDNAAPTENDDVNIDTMRGYCQDLLVGTIMLPQYITGASMTEADGIYTIEFTGNETFAQLIDAEACTTLYQNDTILKSTAQSYTADTMTCYLKIDMATGLPVASGFDYQGTYTIDKLPYSLQFQADQQYTLLKAEAGAQ